jgi:hypothetical protein
MPAKFSGLRVNAGDVHVFYGPCGGGFGDPLERPAAKVLDDVLDDFCTVEHARHAYGVVLDPIAETVDEAATKALRERMRAQPRATAATAQPRQAAPALPQVAAPATAPKQPEPSRLRSRGGGSRLSSPPIRPVAAPAPGPVPQGNGSARAAPDFLQQLREAYGDAWSFEIVQHVPYSNTVEVVGQLRANGSTVRETATITKGPQRSLGELLERAAHDSLRKCVETLMRNGH